MLLQIKIIGLISLQIAKCLSVNCNNNVCECGGEGKKTYIKCNEKNRHFPGLNEIPISTRAIYLKNNKIQHLPNENGERSEMWIIDISGNKIRSIEGNQLGRMFPKLSTLDLSRNIIQHLRSNSFINLKNLNHLNLASNQIGSIEESVFENLEKLHNLNLASNFIIILDFRWFKHLNSLNTISLTHNKIIRAVRLQNGWPRSLKHIHLNNNRIPIFLPVPNNVETFDVSENPLYCGCKPETFEVKNISMNTLCKVSMTCSSGLVMEHHGQCENKSTSKKVYNLWTKFSNNPNCKKPLIKDLKLVKDGLRAPRITCVGSGYPAPHVSLVHNKTKQSLTVSGLEGHNATSVTQTTLKPGWYVCKAINYVDQAVDKIKVSSSELWPDVTDKVEATDDPNVTNISQILVSFNTANSTSPALKERGKSLCSSYLNRQTNN